MTTVLVVDRNPASRQQLKQELQDTGQFARVTACDGLEAADLFLQQGHTVDVMLCDTPESTHARCALDHLRDKHPDLGVVFIQERDQWMDKVALQKAGADAQVLRMSSPMELIACVAKALVARIKTAGKRTSSQ
ncbi:MAG TPA: response regulator [Limnobacter sp.]|uniref:response regulator n=1 Tax=Limnobacter sp. TaxID=2003368 RepID=UPI002ED8F24D